MITIDFKEVCNGNSPELYGRIVSQKLFNIYRAGNGNLGNLKEFFYDITSLTEWFTQDSDFKLYWDFDEDGTTRLSPGLLVVPCWKISFDCLERTVAIKGIKYVD